MKELRTVTVTPSGVEGSPMPPESLAISKPCFRCNKTSRLAHATAARSLPIMWIALLVFLSGITAHADVAQALDETRAEASSARAELAAERTEITAERAALAMQYESAQAEVRALRERWREIQQVTSRREAEQTMLRRRAEATEAEVRNVAGLLTEFRRASESLMPPASLQRHAELLARIDEKLAAADGSVPPLDAAQPAIELALFLLLEEPVSRPFPGFVLDEAGRVLDGRFVTVGPFAYFLGDGIAGYVDPVSGAAEPVLADLLGRRERRALDAWADGSESLAPVDVTDGALVRIVRARPSLIERVRQGGAVMIPLLLIAVVCLVILVRRHVALHRMEIDVNPALTKILAHLGQGEAEEARALADGLASPWGDVLAEAVDHWRADRVYLEEILQDRIVMQAPQVSKELGALAICAAAAPLLGLLGTVTGMIHTFQLITIFGTGDARSLSGGISEALITTQFGLTIAVPVLLAHAYLARRAKAVMTGLEQAAIRFVRNLPPGKEAS